MKDIDKLCINTIRFLAVDSVEKAKSGHPGMPLGAAPTAYVLWDRFLKHNPRNPSWPNRDRFILSAGHGSALLYALLHAYGYNISRNDLRNFRQLRSKTPGHPEYNLKHGVEATTGPLGQGFGMGIGMALAENLMGGFFNESNYPIIDHYTYSIVSDGDLMEGVCSESASLAGTMNLNKLIYLYDDNHISIEGDTNLSFTENVQMRFEAFNWRVFKVEDGNNLEKIQSAIIRAKSEKIHPSIIMIRTHIGYGSPKQDSAKSHGEPLGEEAVISTKKNLGWPSKPTFYIPRKALKHFHSSINKGNNTELKWKKMFQEYQKDFPKKAKSFKKSLMGDLPPYWTRSIRNFTNDEGPMATRNAGGIIMNAINNNLHKNYSYPMHLLIGGSADLAPSTKTMLIGYGEYGLDDNCSHNIHFGVREHAMGAISNGIALHGGFIPYTATFLVFSDYMRPAIRLAALMQTKVIFIFTHDSIALGEDGPTHQPVEQLMSLRAIPGLTVIRPADANETAIAWKVALKRSGPTALILTRQKISILDSKKYPISNGVPRGAYIISGYKSIQPDIILIGSGSELHLCLKSQEKLVKNGLKVRVISMPSWEIFDEQEDDYKNFVLPTKVPKLAIEAGITHGWERYVGEKGSVIGVNQFGVSGPGEKVYNNFGFSIENIIKNVMKILRK